MSTVSRRDAMRAALAAALPVTFPARQGSPGVARGRLKQSVCRWCYRGIPLADFCRALAGMGLTAMDLLTPDEWPTARQFGLTCSMGSGLGGTIENGLNDPANHEPIVSSLIAGIPVAAKAGVPNVITFFGNRRGRTDEDAIANCVKALNRVKGVAEAHGVTVCVELLNSKVNHKDYQCDYSKWGVELVKRVGSERFKLLYDIYHMQIMEGDICDTIKENHQYFDHYHTGGVPGRNEIDDSQELQYPRIMQAIIATGFKGYVAQEFIPKRDPLASLKQAVGICDV